MSIRTRPITRPITRGITRGLGALSSPWFFAPLQTTIVLTNGQGSGTFTRATTAIVCDWENRCRLTKSGEVRFQGARRVENLVPLPENIANGVGGVATVSATITSGIADPIGGTSAFTLTATGASGQYTGAAGTQPSGDYRPSVFIRRRTGTGAIFFCNPDGSFGADVSGAVTSSWQRIAGALQSGLASGARFHGLRLATNGDAIDIWHPQLENVSGQSNQNPSEYVSQGVLSAPYHGANVDGVKYFTTQNGNTVASSVVTEATGAAISTATLLGYLSEQQSTNLVLQSENFGTTWAAVGTPTRVAASDRLGSIVLDTIGDDDAAALEGYTQTVTFTADAVKAISIYVKAGTSTSTVIRLRDTTAGADRLLVALAWAGGVPTPTATTGSVLATEALGNSVYRIRLATTSVTAANVNSLQVYPATDAALAVAATGTVLAGGVQAENSTFCTSYIPTTTATVTRNKDVLTYPVAGNLNDAAGTAYAEVNVIPIPNGGRIVGDSASAAAPLALNSGDWKSNINDGTTNLLSALGGSSGVTQKSASNWVAGGNMNVYLNGASKGTAAYDGAFGITSIGIGESSSTSLNGTVRNVKLWRVALTDEQVALL